MRVEVKIDERCKEPEIVIYSNRITNEVAQLQQKLSQTQLPVLVGFDGSSVELLEPEDIVRFYSLNQKVYAELDKGDFLFKFRLYELEEMLDNRMFLRISNSEIVNLKKIEKLDLSFVGTICIKLNNGKTTYVSRRYVPKIKQILGL